MFSLQEKILLDKWLYYLTWVEKNPLELKSEDYVARMQGAYRQAVVPMRFRAVLVVYCTFPIVAEFDVAYGGYSI